ncbi:MAG: phage recombination protein Bet [Methanobacteriota archaeon]
MKFCSVTGCGNSITDGQAETTERLFGKAFCLEHEKGARAEADIAAGALTIDTAPYVKCGFNIQNGLACKIVGQAELTIDIGKVAASRPKTESIQIGGYDYVHNSNPDVDTEVKALFKLIEQKQKGGAGEIKKERPAPVEKHEEEPKKAETGKDKRIEEPETRPEKPEGTVPGNVIAVLDKYGWAINNNIATKAVASHGVLIDLTKLDRRGKAVYVDTYPYVIELNTVIDAELRRLFGEIAKAQNPKENHKMETKYDEVKRERSPPKVLENAVVRIESLELNTETVLRYLCPDASVEEALMFLQVCKIKNLNPFSPGEVFLIKYDKTQPASIVVGKYAFTKKADQHPDYRGYQAGIIVLNADGKIEEREGTFYLPKGRNAKGGDVFETLLGGWARIKRENREDIVVKVALHECVRYKKDGQPNRSWAEQPATMIQKTAVVRGLRDTFPAELGGLYEENELREVD